MIERVVAALTDEDEIAHGEAWDDNRKAGLGVCAYCDREWPCHTQQAIDRLLAVIDPEGTIRAQMAAQTADSADLNG